MRVRDVIQITVTYALTLFLIIKSRCKAAGALTLLDQYH